MTQTTPEQPDQDQPATQPDTAPVAPSTTDQPDAGDTSGDPDDGHTEPSGYELTPGVTADRAQRFAVYDTRLLRFISPTLDAADDGRDYGATRSGRYQVRRV